MKLGRIIVVLVGDGHKCETVKVKKLGICCWVCCPILLEYPQMVTFFEEELK
jgi:hypothetical protein